MSEFADYSAVDPVLESWARRHGFEWQCDYKGDEVRSLAWPLTGAESIQIWISPPSDSRAAVNVAHNSSFDSRRRTERLEAEFRDLEKALDDALATAMKWQMEALA